MKIVLLLFSVLLALPNLLNTDINHTSASRPVYDGVEIYNPALQRLNSLEKLEAYTDSLAASRNISVQQSAYLLVMAEVIKERFFHGYSHYSLSQNWIAAVAERAVGHALSCTVQSDDILQYPYAACSQQAMIMMDMLKRKGIPCRHVAFQHHYALEAESNGNWYFFDPNMEPNLPLANRSHHLWANNADYLKPFYGARYSKSQLDYIFGNGQPATWGTVNEATASNAKLFHTVTKFASHWLWLLPLVLVFVKRRHIVFNFSRQASFVKGLWLILGPQQKRQSLEPSA